MRTFVTDDAMTVIRQTNEGQRRDRIGDRTAADSQLSDTIAMPRIRDAQRAHTDAHDDALRDSGDRPRPPRRSGHRAPLERGEAMATTDFDQTQRVRIPHAEAGAYVRSRVSRGLIALFIVIPLVAAIAAGAILMQRPVRYQSTLRITVPNELSASASGIGLYLANLELQLFAPEVAERVAKQTGIDADAYMSGLSLSRVGQSSSADFTFESTDPETAAKVVETVVSAALRSLATEGLPFAEREVELAEESYDTALRDLDQFRSTHGVVYPEEQYSRTIAEIEASRADLASAEAAGDSVEVGQLTPEVAELEQRLGVLEEVLPRYQELDDARAVALELRSRARDRLARKQAEIRLTDPDNVRQGITTTQMSRTSRVVQGAIAAAAATLFLLFVVFLLPDLLRPGRSRRVDVR